MSAKYFNDVGCGFVPGRTITNIFGNVFNLANTSVPCTLWPLESIYQFPAAAESWQIRSTSPNDTAAGTGARLVAITTLDAAYIQTTQVIALNGTTPVVLPGGPAYFRVNSMVVVDSGSSHVNVGDLFLESVPGNVPRAFIFALGGNSLSFIYTVPAGHNLWIPNFFTNSAKSGGGSTTWRSASRLSFPNGTSIVGGTQAWETGGIPITVPTGFVIPEKVDFEFRVIEVGSSGININFQVTGILTDLTDPSVIQRLPTAFTEY